MKRNNVAKTFGIASLCLGVAVSAFSGISSFNKSISFSSKAETTSVQGTDFVSASGDATTTVTQDANGLRVSSDVGYQATFNRVFYGDTKFAFHFPERNSENTVEAYQSYITPHGDFTFRVTDATDESNFFEVQYYVSRSKNGSGNASYNWTGVILKYGEEIRTTSVNVSATTSEKQTWYNVKTKGIEQDSSKKNFLPSFLGTGSKGSTVGRLSFLWSADGVLSVNARAATYTDQDFPIAKFDGTYDATKSKNGFVSKTSWGLPKISFPNGYKISFSSEFTTTKTTDKGTDVMFTSITNGKTYNFKTATEYANDNYLKANNKVKAETGKVLIGWKDAENALYSTAAALKSTDISTYSPVYLGFDTKNGASARIESASKSGIRFMTIFNVDDYAAAKDYITSFGTLIAHTNTLTSVGKDFTIDNYSGDATFKQVPNTKSVFTYKDKNTGTRYTAYTMAIVDIAPESYTKEYSARGYIEVTYADTTTQIFYTDYNVADNSRSIAKVAYLLTQDTTAYEALSDARKAIVDSYAAAYVVPEE